MKSVDNRESSSTKDIEVLEAHALKGLIKFYNVAGYDNFKLGKFVWDNSKNEFVFKRPLQN